MFFDDQNGYITASYVLTALTFIALTLWALCDQAKQKKALAELEAKDILRKDSGQNPE